MKKYINIPFKAVAKCLSLFVLSCTLVISAKAVEEPYLNELKGAQVAVNNFFAVADEKFNSSTSWNLIRQNYSVDNIITFEINFDTTLFFYNTPFDCTVNFKIYLYGNQSDTSEITDSTTYSNISLTVNYDTVTGKPYKGIAMYKFAGSHKYKVKILGLTSPQLSPIPGIFRLKGQIIVSRQYKFQDNSTDITTFAKVNGNQLQLSWIPGNYPGAEQFDLEYTFIDSSSQVGASIRTYNTGGYYYVPADSLDKWFRNNNSRISTASSSYLLNIPYDSGYVLFRIRGVQDSLGVRIEGNWNYLAKTSGFSCPSDCPKGVVFFAGHETNLNWQYAVVFAEEGKRKEVISYFDGTLRNRQSVTINNSDNKNVVQETIYDALGRPAASILPAPTNDSTIHYFRAFNRNSGGTNAYSYADLLFSNCVTTADSVSHSSGAGKYYSTSNSFQGAYYYAKYIPNAGGYPIATTEYMADNTGRIKAQSGVGAAFQMSSNHETKYYYGKPTQTELDRLFGLEAGNASHYLKNMVIDANGQVSVSYLDASGKTIATALAGSGPSNLHQLSSASGSSISVTNTLISAEDFSRDASTGVLSASSTFLAPVTGNYIFNYRLDSLTYRKLYGANKDSTICSHCYYDLEILIKSDCSDTLRREIVSAGAVFDTACATPPASIQDSLHVNISTLGEYYITYKLIISSDALSYYDSVHLAKNTDIKKLNYFLIEELKNTDFYGCYSDCRTCVDRLGSKTDFIALFKTMYQSDSLQFYAEDSLAVVNIYDSLYAHCQSLQAGCVGNVCDEKLQLLKLDVSPGGQYALYDTTDISLLEVPINVLDKRNQISIFRDEYGNPDTITVYNQNGEDSVRIAVTGTSLSDSMFISRWKDSWADSLVKLHPEYCYYLWCVANSSSYEFDKEIEDWLDADTAIARGWFSTTVYDTILAHDPFFLSGGNGYALRFKMQDSLRLFSRSSAGLAQSDKNILKFIDLLLYCKKDSSCNAWDNCSVDSNCRSRNREWFLYKTFYLNLKQIFYERARRTSTDTIFSNCSNCFIGQDLPGLTGFSCDSFDFADFIVREPCILDGGVVNDCVEFFYTKTYVKPLRKRIAIYYRYKGAVCAGNPGGFCYETGYMDPGDSTLQIPSFKSSITDVEILSINCDTIPYIPYTDTTCIRNCSTGTYSPYDRDSLSVYIQNGNPNSAPTGVPGGYGNCRFYPVFILKTGAADTAYCKFLNVWVCSYDSTCGGVCSDTTFASQCIASGTDTLYRNKIRRYNDYVNTEQLMQDINGTNLQEQSTVMEELVIVQCKQNCESQADLWMNLLNRCNMSSGDSTSLRAALIDICSKGCAQGRPFGTSSIPGSISATYHSFEEAIEDILGPGAINDSCTQELLSNPYPYDKQPVYIERQISETDSAICARVNNYYYQYDTSSYTGSFHSYMQLIYGAAYSLDSLELDDLLNSCNNCNYLLKNDLVLPVLFDPQSGTCLPCDSLSDAFDDFETKFPSITIADDDYEILFTNYFNHRFGFSLTYDRYRAFLDSCDAHSGAYTGLLCNMPATIEILADPSQCTRELFSNALSNAYNIYIAYIDSVRRDFREAYTTRCMSAQPLLTMTSSLYEYHYTLYYYDQSGNLVKTVPPEGVQLLDNTSIAEVQSFRSGSNPACSNSNSMVFTNGSANFPGGTANAPQLNVGSGAFTIEAWIKLSSFADQGIVSNNHHSGSYNTGYSLGIISNKLTLHMGENSASYKVEATSQSLSTYMSTGTWTHIAVQRTSISTVKMYINGNPIPVLYNSNTPNTGNLDHGSTDNFYVGASNKDGSISKLSSGQLRHLRVYTRALTATEVRQNHTNHCGSPANATSLVFWEPFTEGLFTASGGNDYVYERIYNAAGQKSGTIAFETAGSTTLVPAHRLVTTYQYNSLNQVLQQYSPDGDTSVFFYDRLARLIVSQNKEQLENASYSGSANRFSYTLYDGLGRIYEVGEKSEPVDDIRNIELLNDGDVQSWMESGTNRQITRTIYDNPVNLNLQEYTTSRKRVVASIYLEEAEDSEGDSTLYSYDITGNVKLLVQHIKTLVAADPGGNGRKRIDYSYDLVSGKVNMVSYQHGKGDQFYYKYSYDADNRVVRSYSSRDKLLWIEDASYMYYLHGPLARTELGHYKVQGTDYAYTLQGWLKGINSDSLQEQKDMGGDGWQQTTYGRVSRDVYGFKLGYFSNDYTPIGGATAGAFSNKTYSAPGSLDQTGNELFNGNISFTTLALSKLVGAATTGYSYGYDQLNRLVEMRQHSTGTTSGWSNSSIVTAYRESISYDANGNILKYLRKGHSATPHMDSLTYQYNYSSGMLINNRLNHVSDSIPAGNYSEDIDDQDAGNYQYDYIGNLKADGAEKIDTIRWTVYGKINRIAKSEDNVSIDYSYDAGGNRTRKRVNNNDTISLTWYVRDAQGNVMAVYSNKEGTDEMIWKEQHLYGSSRLGMWRADTTVPAAPPVVDEDPVYDSVMLGSRTYELTNHLGNVLATISDKKIGNDSSGVVNYYIAEVLSQTDYYPGGMLMPGRQYSATTGYRYGFNGKEKDTESPVQYDYGFRIYDPRLVRFKSVDPLSPKYPELTPYQFASNTPIKAVDLDGLETSWRPAGELAPRENAYTFGSQSTGQKTFNRGVYALKSTPKEQPTVKAGATPTLAEKAKMSKPANWREEMDVAYKAWDATIGKEIHKEIVESIENSPTNFFPVISNLKKAGKYELMGMHKEAAGSLKDAGLEVALGYGAGKALNYGLKYLSAAKTSINVVEQVAVHGNSLKSLRPTWGYKLYSADGTFLKNGITSKLIPETRYTKSFMSDKYMVPFKQFPNRLEAYQWEFGQNQILRGPLNLNMH